MCDPRTVWEVERISHAAYFTVVRENGRDVPRIRLEVASLAEALSVRDEVGVDQYGRQPMIYAVTEDRMTIHIDHRHLKLLGEKT